MPARHAFVQQVTGAVVEERHQRAEESTSRTGHVQAAAFVRVARAGAWARLRARLAGSGSPARAELLRPFDAAGGDPLALLAAPPPDLARDEERVDSPRRVVGRVAPLAGGGSVVVDDAWFGQGADTWRVTEGVDFVLEAEEGDVVIVSFGLAPLVVSEPRPADVLDHLDSLLPTTRRLVPAHRARPGPGDRLTVAVGDEIEVWGMCRGFSQSGRVHARTVDYRSAPRPPRVVGDEDGTRLVIARRGPASSR